ncbi:hypothetical protein EUX98_g9754 [Antrodiella citrinella]|uniref:Uncharacterized protein n=1 Tax=Antrodiella citrinella TaxID=2447956 RepID=A0A4S4LM28_9APHY|nr:hypothetical protein EUX98_g9754 [Antrodiella citrinella]
MRRHPVVVCIFQTSHQLFNTATHTHSSTSLFHVRVVLSSHNVFIILQTVNSASFSLASVSAHAAPTGDDNNTMNVDDTAFNDLLDDSGNAANVDDDALNSLMHSIDVGALNNGDSFTGPSSSFTPHLLHKAR